MAEFEKKVRDVLRKNHWRFARMGKGDHEIWQHPDKPGSVPVDGKIKSRHIANAIMKQCGIDFRFK